MHLLVFLVENGSWEERHTCCYVYEQKGLVHSWHHWFCLLGFFAGRGAVEEVDSFVCLFYKRPQTKFKTGPKLKGKSMQFSQPVNDICLGSWKTYLPLI